jgi:hypothetical protein
MISTIRKINKWYDRLEDPKRFCVFFLPFVIFLLAIQIVGFYNEVASNLLMMIGFVVIITCRLIK